MSAPDICMESSLNRVHRIKDEESVETLLAQYEEAKASVPPIVAADGSIIRRDGYDDVLYSGALYQYFLDNVCGKAEKYKREYDEPYATLYEQWLDETYGQSKMRQFWDYAFSIDGLQTALEIGGFIFEPCDLVNAGIYALRGKPKEAFWSAVGAVPMLGSLAGKGGKFVSAAGELSSAAKVMDDAGDLFSLAKAADNAEDLLSVAKVVDNVRDLSSAVKVVDNVGDLSSAVKAGDTVLPNKPVTRMAMDNAKGVGVVRKFSNAGESGSDTRFKYVHNPSDNPKVLRDAIEDPNAVYGYRPRKDGSLASFTNGKWDDPIAVEGYRQDRIAYHNRNEGAAQQIVSNMTAEGEITEDIARAVNEYRNQSRINAYIDSNGNIKNIDGYNAALARACLKNHFV